ncbi:MAG: transposase [SAR324 cluster bacterium]|nr:transposase [SAR324 cluster bacterium]
MKKRSFDEKRELIAQVGQLRTSDGLSIKAICKNLGISVVSYYNWKKQIGFSGGKEEYEAAAQGIPGVIAATRIQLEDRIKILEVKAQFPHMGVKQLRQYLIRNNKLVYSERQIRQFLKAENVPSLKSAFPNQPLRRFERDLSNEMWQIDMMNVYVGTQSLYLTNFLDDHSRFIVSYSVSEEQSSSVVLSLLKRAVSFRKPLSIITDRGIQFCSWNGVTAFQMELKSLGIDHLLAREQHPETMGKIEAFHKTIKRELLTTTEFSGIREAKSVIHDYIMFYNFARPHMGIADQAPAERYFKRLRAYNHQSVYYRKVVPTPGPNDEITKGNFPNEKTLNRTRKRNSSSEEKSQRTSKGKPSQRSRSRDNRRSQWDSGGR